MTERAGYTPTVAEYYEKYYPYLNDDVREAIKNNVYTPVAEELASRSSLRVLLLGAGGGRLEIPLIETLGDTVPGDLTVTAVDSSDAMISHFKDRFQKKFGNNDKIRLEIHTLDIRDFEFEKYEKYDVVTAFFVLHMVSQWGEVLKKIITSLNPQGFFLFAEETGSTAVIDNLLPSEDICEISSLPKEYFIFWKKFFDERIKLGKPWFQPIAASDYGLVSDILANLDFEKKEYNISLSSQPAYSMADFLDWLDDIYLFLPIGRYLTKEDRKKIKNEVERFFSDSGQLDLNKSFDRKEGHRFLCFKKKKDVSPTYIDAVTRKSVSKFSKQTSNLSLLDSNICIKGSRSLFNQMEPPCFESPDYITAIKNRLFITGITLLSCLQKRVHFDYVMWKEDYFSDNKSRYVHGLPSFIHLEPDKGNKDIFTRYIVSYSLYFFIRSRVAGPNTFIDFMFQKFRYFNSIIIKKGEEVKVSIEFGRDKSLMLVITLPPASIETEKLDDAIKSLSESIENDQHFRKDNYLYDFDNIIDIAAKKLDKTAAELLEKYADNLFTGYHARYYDTFKKSFLNEIENFVKLFGISTIEDSDVLQLFKSLFCFNFIGAGGDDDTKWRIIRFYVGFIFGPEAARDGYNILTVIDFYKDDIVKAVVDIPSKVWSSKDGLYASLQIVREYVYKHALQSAISTIMSRNMSHNLGSHVLINFERREFGSSEQLGSVNTFLQYIRFRMDFIAQIATEWPLWLTPTRFCQDLLYSFFQQQFILEYISASEHLCAEKIRFFIHISEDNNKEVIFEPVNPTNSEKVNEFRKQLLESEKLIPMRGGGTGRHAFYVILENFIRNAAKHSYSGSGNLDIHIRLKDCEENYIVELWDNVSCGEKLIKDIREKSGQKIIDDSGKIRKGSWGIAEIKICSAFLGHKNIMDLVPSQGQNGSPMVVDEEKVENKSYLKYSFAIPKAREVLIISPDGAICPNIKGGIWVEKSFNIFDANDSSFSYEVCVICPPENADGKGKQSLLCEMLDDIGINLERMPSRLLWVGDEKDFAKTLDNYPYITKRVAIISKEDFCQHKNKISLNPEEFKLWLYTKWIIHLRDNVVGDSKCKGKKFYLYLKLTENKSDSLVTPYLSDYLQKNYPYLIAPLVLNPEESSDRDTGWNSLNKIFENKNSALKEVIEKVVVNDTINCDDMPIIAFPRHGYEHDSNLSHLKDRLFYSEYISGASPHFNVIASLPEDRYQMQKLAMLMVEGALPRITVIDERIGKATANCCDELRANSGITCIQKIVFDVGDNGEQQSELGVYGLSEADEWNMSSFTVQFKKDGKVEELNGDEVEKLQTDILFIHQGIIDKLMQRKFWKDKNDMEKWFKMVKKDIPFVVVTSGRGQPDEIPDNVKFIPLSDVLQSFFGRQTTKLLLTYICMHARS